MDGVQRDWGHVGLAVGDGSVVHAWDVVRIDDAEVVTALQPSPGWSAPRLTGWAPPEDVLHGHAPREWDARS